MRKEQLDLFSSFVPRGLRLRSSSRAGRTSFRRARYRTINYFFGVLYSVYLINPIRSSMSVKTYINKMQNMFKRTRALFVLNQSYTHA